MFGNWWHKKERPLLGLTGLMGGNSSGMISGGKIGKFTIDGGSEYESTTGYSTPVQNIGGQHFSLEVTSGPFTATVKMWGGGGGGAVEGGCAGCGGFIKGDFEFLEGSTYQFVKGGGGKRTSEGTQPYGGGGQGFTGPLNSRDGGGGGGYSGFFKAPAPTPAANTRAQDYAILVVGGGGGMGGASGEAGAVTNIYMPTSRGGAGGSAMPPAEPPFGPPNGNFGGGHPTDPTAPYYPLRGQSSVGSGNQGGGAPYPQEGGPTNDGNPEGGYGGERGASEAWPGPAPGWGYALHGGTACQNQGGAGGGGGGGFITIPAVHPEGISCPGPSIEGMIGLKGPSTPQLTCPNPTDAPRAALPTAACWDPVRLGANSSDPDRGNAGNAALARGPNWGDPWSDAYYGGTSGKVVIREG